MTAIESLTSSTIYQDLTGTVGEVATVLDGWRQQGLLNEVKTIAEHGGGRYTVRAYLLRQPERPALPHAPSPYRWGVLDYLCAGIWVLRVTLVVGVIVVIGVLAFLVYTHLYLALAVGLGATLALLIASMLGVATAVGCAGVIVHCAGCRG